MTTTPDLRAISEALAERLLGWSKPSTRGRCDVCGWPVHDIVELGCTPDSCSQRPPPEHRADKPPDVATTGEGMLRLLDAATHPDRTFYCEDCADVDERLIATPDYNGCEPIDVEISCGYGSCFVNIRCDFNHMLYEDESGHDSIPAAVAVALHSVVDNTRAALAALDREAEGNDTTGGDDE